MDCYDNTDTLIHTYRSSRWIITPQYTHKEHTFQLPQEIVDSTVSYQIILITSKISSENPLYFNQVMLNEGEYTEYHIPNDEKVSWMVKFNNNSYDNLYNKNGTYLQVIRPQKDKFLTNLLTKSNCTILAPHLFDEPSTDNPVNIFLEFVNQSEQRIDVLR